MNTTRKPKHQGAEEAFICLKHVQGQLETPEQSLSRVSSGGSEVALGRRQVDSHKARDGGGGGGGQQKACRHGHRTGSCGQRSRRDALCEEEAGGDL